MSLEDAAKAASVSKATVQRFESGGTAYPVTRAALQRAFEERGAIFLGVGELTSGGAGVRLASEEVAAS